MIYTLLKTIKYVKLIFQTKKSHEFQNNIVLTLTIPIAQSPSTDKKEECSLQKDKILEMEVVREQGLEVISIDFRKYYCILINPIIINIPSFVPINNVSQFSGELETVCTSC